MKYLHVFAVFAACHPAMVLADEYGGQLSGRYTHQETMPQDQQGQAVVVGLTATGTNKSSGRIPFMDDARVVWGSVVALERGSGPEQGIITLVAPDGVAIAAYRGVATTQRGANGPLVSGQGTWEALSGTGAFRDYTGKGTYTRTGLSQTDFTGEWKGTLTKGRSAPETTASPRP